jgi:hypothetical protein
MSAAWVSYVKSIRRPTPSIIYSDPSMKPNDARTEEILLTTSAAPSLADYLVKVSNLNPIYTQLRDAAWAEAQATGNMTPDPRFLANLDRTRSIPAKGRFLLVNAGDQRLTLYQDGQVIDSMKVIVGTPQLPIINIMTQLLAQRLRDAGVNVDVQMGVELGLPSGAQTVSLNAFAGGTAAIYYFNVLATQDKANMAWTQNVLTFTAQSSTTVVGFVSLTSSNCCYGPVLDDISVTEAAVPEPVDGMLAMPTAPGLGLEFDQATLDRYRA